MSDSSLPSWQPPKPPHPPRPPAPTPEPGPGPGPAPAPGATRRFTFTTAARDDQNPTAFAFEVIRMRGEEGISMPFRFELLLMSANPSVHLDAVLKAGATFTILPPTGEGPGAPYHGCLAEFEQLHKAGKACFYRAVLVPHLWLLSLSRRSDIHLHKSILDVMAEVLDQRGLKQQQGPGPRYEPQVDAASGFALNLRDLTRFRTREYVCQYQESPLDFISRWLEKEGIYYYFDHDGRSSDLMVLLDEKGMQQPGLEVRCQSETHDTTGLEPDLVQVFTCRIKPTAHRVALRDFNEERADDATRSYVFPRGSDPLEDEMLYGENVRGKRPASAPGERAPAADPVAAEGERYARVRAEERACSAQVFYGEASAVGLRSGRLMTLKAHFRDDYSNRRYLVTELTHEGEQADLVPAGVRVPGAGPMAQQRTYYRNHFVALPEETQYRPALRTPRPHIAGTLSATIDAEGDGQYAEMDELGRYTVRMPFDAEARPPAKASARIRMASSYAGAGHGLHFPLHKGAEVLLAFAGGDPDQPVIVGAVPNSTHPSVVNNANPRESVIRTAGQNEIVIDDTKGKEVIWLRSPYNSSVFGVGYTGEPPKPDDKPDDKPAPVVPAPAAPSNLLFCTKGGSDSVSMGHSNSMSFGSKNALSLSTEASLSAAFANKVSVGASIAIGFANDVKWNMDLGATPGLGKPIQWLGGMKSLSISDSKEISLKVDSKTAVKGSILLSAGADDSSVTNLGIDAKLEVLREAVRNYTVANFAVSTILGMSVNGSMRGLVTPDAALGDKKSFDAEVARKKREDDIAKAAEVAAVEDKWDKANASDKKEMDELAKKKDPSEDDKKRLAVLKEKKAAATFADKKAIDDRYSERAADASKFTAFNGWQGVAGAVTKFGVDVAFNLGFMAYVQKVAGTVADDLEKLETVSKMTMNFQAIEQTLSIPSGVPGNAVRESQFALVKGQGIVAKSPGFVVDVTAPAAGPVGAPPPPSIILKSDKDASIEAPLLSFKHGQPGTVTAITLDNAAGTISLEVPQSKFQLVSGDATLTGNSVKVGHEIVGANPAYAVLSAQRDALHTAYHSAADLWVDATRAYEAAAGTPAQRALKNAADAAHRTMIAAYNAWVSVRNQIASTRSQLSAPFLNGLQVSAQKTELTHQAVALTLDSTGGVLSMGGAKLQVNVAGLTGDGALIKLG